MRTDVVKPTDRIDVLSLIQLFITVTFDFAGLFFFDSRFRPVPLTTTFIGVKSEKHQQMNDMDEICFEKVIIIIKFLEFRIAIL